MNMLSFLSVAILFLHVDCQSPVRHGDHGGGWAVWSSWTRERDCLAGTCVGNHTETTNLPCTDNNGTDPGCGPWSSWELCPDGSSCDQKRTKDCQEQCFNDKWSPWGSWSDCSHSCGGYKSRSRYCIKMDCTVNNPGCIGESSQTVDCDHVDKGILITAYNQAELFIPSTKGTLSLPSIPGSPRVWHTLTRNVLCGGVYPGTSTNCLELTQGGWGWTEYNLTLNQFRLAHSAWDSPSGIVLMGGHYSGDTTELINSTNTISQFSLNHPISHSCAIVDGAKVVLTGGFGYKKNVACYNMSGFVQNLPELHIGRQYHACAGYINEFNQQTFLVTGGFTGLQNTKSTEILTTGATAWMTVGPLPKARNGLRATSVDNIIYVLGGDTEILKFEPSANNTWTVFSQMTKKAGSKLEVSTVNCRIVHHYWDENEIKYFD